MNNTKYLRSAFFAIALLCTAKKTLPMEDKPPKYKNGIISLLSPKITSETRQLLDAIEESRRVKRAQRSIKFKKVTRSPVFRFAGLILLIWAVGKYRKKTAEQRAANQ